MGFSLEKFEAYAYSQNHEMGMRELKLFLDSLDSNYGSVGSDFEAQPLYSVSQFEVDQHIFTRIASATSCLLSNKSLVISPEWTQRLLATHRWIFILFAASPFHNADHVIRALNVKDNPSDLNHLEVAQEELLKFCLLYTPDSEIALDLDALWAGNKELAACLCLVLLSPRFLGSPLAHSKREQILPWLAARLDQIDDIEQLPIGVLHDLYMHCSYADRADKHDIKKSINALIRRKLRNNHVLEIEIPRLKLSTKPDKNKPVMLVILEWFGSSHSIYRTHSRTIEGARRHFRVVAMAYENCVDEVTKQVFDEFIPLSNVGMMDQLKQIQDVAQKLNAQICYMPSVGMFPLTMWVSNLRIAPLQMMALGHPATTHAHAIDYVVVEEDYVGSKNCFSEKLLILPKDGMPYRPSASAKEMSISKKFLAKPEVVKIAVCATTMKLNPSFLQACAQIIEKSRVPIEFRFLVGQAQGMVYHYVQRVVKRFLGDGVIIYPHQNYQDYMAVISDCDMFINPFPFGNTNGIIDTVSAGLIGVCKTGPEVHEHIDQGMFERLNYPKWMVAENITDYVNAAVRLAENHAERIKLSKTLSGKNKVDVFFNGRPEILGDLFIKKLKSLRLS
ncbi:peptide transporter [Polynucleobacter sp. JS-Fieb-80-E5]|uniref:peptide transporter n=1 Tax=Polynucleobacter sp. JS-Fieb-80-E5 TaxID=2081050 RepID=UPI001C0ABE13|nr:peptide transporter [Polynucleobacter sp. JS-Fieb-80-E5]MBU3617849.1 peptide transporter [Polynucleobacter sp. JS-Fieb-80-E5]